MLIHVLRTLQLAVEIYYKESTATMYPRKLNITLLRVS